MVKPSLLLFTIGPVQPFIAQARKTRDLWVGSFLLSKLMQAAMSDLDGKLDEEGKPRLIFPFNPKTSKQIPDLPNKFVALLASEEEARQTAREAERLLRARWKGIADEVWKHLTGWAPDIKQAQKVWDSQILFKSFFEVYWAIAPEQEPGEPYGGWYARAQRALDARKRLRDFQQQEEAEPGEKSTISGERQVLHGSKGDIESVRKFWADIAEKYPPAQISHDGSERLDAIDAIKRYATVADDIPNPPFPSTSTVAAAPFFAALLVKAPEFQALSKELKNWEKLTDVDRMAQGANPDGLPYLAKRAGTQCELLWRDGDCFYPETYTPERLNENYGLAKDAPRTQELVKSAPAVLRALRQAAATDDVKIQPLNAYYAVLTMDGDHMGTLLSNVADRHEHRKISGALSYFSREVAPPLVERSDYPAKLIYAGGDDVLALVPLRDVLPLCQRLQAEYVQAMEPATKVLLERIGKQGKPLHVTMSAGIAIAHYLDPLSHVLREARHAEETAKERYGRNAAVVTLLRRSGEPTTVGCKWQYDSLSEDNQPLHLFEEVQGLLESGALSRKFVYNLAEEAAILSRLDQTTREERSPQESEIKRLLKRGRSKEESLPDDKLESLAKRLAALATKMNPSEANGTKTRKAEEEGKRDEEELWRPGPRRGLVELSGWLLLMAFSLRGEAD